MPGRRIMLTFRHQQAQTYRVDLRTADGRDYTATCSPGPHSAYF
jgi:hypothetical protein